MIWMDSLEKAIFMGRERQLSIKYHSVQLDFPVFFKKLALYTNFCERNFTKKENHRYLYLKSFRMCFALLFFKSNHQFNLKSNYLIGQYFLFALNQHQIGCLRLPYAKTHLKRELKFSILG